MLIIRLLLYRFRWVSMQLEALCAMKIDNNVLERLGKLPRKLTAIYRDIYDRLFENAYMTSEALIKNIFRWLLCARETLPSAAFFSVIVQNISPKPKNVTNDKILDLCCNFVIYDEHRDIFPFVHASVEEFLRNLPTYSVPKSNAVVAECCLALLMHLPANRIARTHLAASKRSRFDYPRETDQYFGYSIRHGLTHCRAAGVERLESPLRIQLKGFLVAHGKNAACSLWIRHSSALWKNCGKARMQVRM